MKHQDTPSHRPDDLRPNDDARAQQKGPARKPRAADERPDWFKRCIDVLTLMVISVGLYFAWDQAEKLNQNLVISNQNNNLSTWNTVAMQTLEIDKVMIANARFSKYIFDGVAIEKSDSDYPQASAIGTLYLDYFDSVLSLLAYMTPPEANASSESKPSPVSPPHGNHALRMILEREAWLNFIRETYKSSPLLCSLIRENWQSYGSQTQLITHPICFKPTALQESQTDGDQPAHVKEFR